MENFTLILASYSVLLVLLDYFHFVVIHVSWILSMFLVDQCVDAVAVGSLVSNTISINMLILGQDAELSFTYLVSCLLGDAMGSIVVKEPFFVAGR
jgi:hypothetical protein